MIKNRPNGGKNISARLGLAFGSNLLVQNPFSPLSGSGIRAAARICLKETLDAFMSNETVNCNVYPFLLTKSSCYSSSCKAIIYTFVPVGGSYSNTYIISVIPT